MQLTKHTHETCTLELTLTADELSELVNGLDNLWWAAVGTDWRDDPNLVAQLIRLL
jgi:hypothetical protein